MESAELKNQRLKEVFQTKIQEFRKVCYALTGYQIDITTENQYRLTSMYAEHKADCLIFKVGPARTRRLPCWTMACVRVQPHCVCAQGPKPGASPDSQPPPALPCPLGPLAGSTRP